MKQLFLALLTGLLLCGGCATTRNAQPAAANPSVAESPTPAAAAVDDYHDDELDCVYETRTGSRIPKKICTTAHERRVMKEGAQRFIRRAQGGVNIPN